MDQAGLPIRVIITGATGMVGEGVLHECLSHPRVEAILILTRKPSGMNHPKLKEVVHADFFDLSAIADQLTGYNACFFCLGVSVLGMKQEAYYAITYTLTLHVAETALAKNPGMTFTYVSGVGTDTSEKGRTMWARIKGKTENALMRLSFRQVFAFRPGFMKPTRGLKNTLKIYRYIGWIYPLGRLFNPNGFCTLGELGQAMINCVGPGNEKKILNGRAIIQLANLKNY